jgi:hypothetical protein
MCLIIITRKMVIMSCLIIITRKMVFMSCVLSLSPEKGHHVMCLISITRKTVTVQHEGPGVTSNKSALNE